MSGKGPNDNVKPAIEALVLDIVSRDLVVTAVHGALTIPEHGGASLPFSVYVTTDKQVSAAIAEAIRKVRGEPDARGFGEEIH